MGDLGGRRPSRRRVNILLYVTEKIGPQVLPYLLRNHDLNVRVVSDISKAEFQTYMQDGLSIDHVQWFENVSQDPYRNQVQMRGHKLARWADLLFLVLDAGMTSMMLSGFTTDVILHAIRCWDTSKRIVMLPEMSLDQWRNPITKRQLFKLQRKWDWVNIVSPALWDYEVHPLRQVVDIENIIWHWDGSEEIVEAIHSEAQSVLRSSRSKLLSSLPYVSSDHSQSSKPRLPVEIWTNILDQLGDWELATSLGAYTHLPTPSEWQSLLPRPNKPMSLEYTILTQPLSKFRAYFTNTETSYQQPTPLSAIATRLICRFSMTNVLTYLALHQKDIFWTTFPMFSLPHKASLIYNSPTILQWWKDCPAVIRKEYGTEALDGASRAGFVEVLDWWLESGLTLSYTEKALESASAKGNIEVLQWWSTNSQKHAGTDREMPLKVGKSILLAAQAGRVESIDWWDRSGIPYTHEETVAKIASQHGHVDVLERWRELKGNKMIYDNQVLVGATKNGHAKVLEWWKEASRKWGLGVEYKTCDIEEAMEDAVGGGGEGEVREWWGRNGLNLGVGTGEWMKVKTL